MADSSFEFKEWCRLRRVSRSKLYQLLKQGRGPRIHYVGAKPLISPQADRDWIRQREAEAADEVPKTWAEPLSADHINTT